MFFFYFYQPFLALKIFSKILRITLPSPSTPQNKTPLFFWIYRKNGHFAYMVCIFLFKKSFVRRVGAGPNLGKFVRSVFRRLMTWETAKQFSMTGNKKDGVRKESLKKLYLVSSVLIRTYRQEIVIYRPVPDILKFMVRQKTSDIWIINSWFRWKKLHWIRIFEWTFAKSLKKNVVFRFEIYSICSSIYLMVRQSWK